MSERTRRADAPAPGAGQPVGDFPLPKPALLAEAIADSVAEAIATGHLAPGERIVETALAEKYGVSRVPVREALKVLATQGILVGGGHRGCRVASFAPEKIEQVFEVRLELETLLLRDAVAGWRRTRTGIGELDAVIATMRQAARADDLRGMLRADLEFHRTICRASANEIVAALWNAIARHVLIIFNLARYRDVDLTRALDQHLRLRDYIEREIEGRTRGGAGTGGFRAELERHFQSAPPGAPGGAGGRGRSAPGFGAPGAKGGEGRFVGRIGAFERRAGTDPLDHELLEELALGAGRGDPGREVAGDRDHAVRVAHDEIAGQNRHPGAVDGAVELDDDPVGGEGRRRVCRRKRRGRGSPRLRRRRTPPRPAPRRPPPWREGGWS